MSLASNGNYILLTWVLISMKKAFLIPITLFLVTLSFSQDFTIKNFDVRIELYKEGYIKTEEDIQVYFDQPRHGIYRDIPYKYKFNGKPYSMSLSNIKVEGQQTSISSSNGMKRIRIGSANRQITGLQSYHISYRMDDCFIHADTYDEFYFNITGNDWKADIEKVQYDITLPDDTPLGYHDLKVFTGRYGAKSDSAYIQQAGRHITGQSLGTLKSGEGLTISLRLPANYIDPAHVVNINASAGEKISKELKIQWPLAVLPAFLVALFVGFWNKMRKPKTNMPIEEYLAYPPDNMSPAEVGGFYDQIVNDRDVISLLPYWAAQGYIRMDYNPNDEDTYLTMIKELDSYRPKYETTLFRSLFAGTTSTSLSSLKYHFHATHSKVKRMIHDDIIGKQVYDAPYRYWFKSFRPWLILIGFVALGVVSMILGYWLTALLFILGFLIGIILVSQPAVLSARGEELHSKLRAFYNFLDHGNPDMIQSIVAKDPTYFDKVFPYAVALKLDKSFVSRIKTYHPQAPMWYGYYGMAGMNQMNTMEHFADTFQPKEINSAFSSVPQPSGSSGGSGGGFSGGGVGGGGGGSW